MWFDSSAAPSWFDWLALLLTLGGLALAAIPMWKSRRDLSEAAKALNTARESISRNQLLTVLPKFEIASQSIDEAIRIDDRDRLVPALTTYRVAAYESAALLAASGAGFAELSARMKDVSDGLVADAQAALYSNPTLTCDQMAGAAASHVRGITVEVAGLAVELRNNLEK